MKKSWIIKKNSDFDRVYRRGKQCHTATLSLFFVRRKDTAHSRVGVTVSRKIRGAVRRNRVKRVLRALFQDYREQIRPGYDLIMLGRTEAPKGSYSLLKKDFRKLLAKAKLYEETAQKNVSGEEGGAL